MMLSHGRFEANFNAIAAIHNGVERWRGQWHIYDGAADCGEPIEKGNASAWHVSRNDAQEDARRGAMDRMKALSIAND